MAKPFAYIYETACGPFEFGDLIEELAAAGIKLAYSETGSLTTLSDCGEVIQASYDDISAQIRERKVVNLQFWGFDRLNWWLAFLFIDGYDIIFFDLAGLAFGETVMLSRAAMRRFYGQAKKGRAAGLVIDLKGYTEENNWDEFVRGEEVLLGEWPDIFITRNDDLRRIEDDISGFSGEFLPGYTVIMNPQMSVFKPPTLPDHP